jgi:hypothetical protein
VNYSDQQRNALHLWCEMCADVLNENQMWFRPQFSNKQLKWDKMRFKAVIYKEYLRVVLKKDSTEKQNSVDPSEVVLALTAHFQQEHGVLLPGWPSLR